MRLLFCILSVFIFFIGSSQPVIPKFETLGVNKGLSQNSVYAIYQDKEGFMWFGTADGLNRYDGDEIKVYKTKTDLNKKGNSNYIRGKLCEDQHGNIWFGTETGIYYYDRSADEIKLGYLYRELKSGIIYYILVGIDKAETLWLENPMTGVVSWQTQKKIWQEFPYEFKANPFTISNLNFEVMDPEGNIWYTLYKNDGLMKFNINQKKYDHFFKDKNIQSIYFIKGKYFLTIPDLIYRYDSATAVTDSFHINLPSLDSKHLILKHIDNYGHLWLRGLDKGLLYFDLTTGRSYQYQHNLPEQKTISSNFVSTIAEDRSENLWIGTDGGGVCKLDLKPPFFNLFPLNEADYTGANDFFTKCIYEDEFKRIWFGTLNGLYIFNPKDGNIKHFSHDNRGQYFFPGTIVSALFRDKDGNTWIGYDKSVCYYKNKTNKFHDVKLPNSIAWSMQSQTALINKIIQLKNNDLVVAANGPVILIKRKNITGANLDYDSKELISVAATDVAETVANELWLTTPIAGLYHTELINDSLITKEIYFQGNDLRCIHIDEKEKNILWIGSSKGLIQFDTKTKKHKLFNADDGMLNSYIYGILEDQSHNFWMSTNGGLVYFNRLTETFQNYTVNEGLQSNEFNTGAFYKSVSGNFYFGGVKGFNWFQTGSFPKSKTKPGVGITSILIQNTPFHRDSLFLHNKTIHLGYSQNDLAFQVAALDYTRPQANKIQYKLINWDEKWIITYNKQIRYGKLLPGEYTFVVKASNNTGEWSDEEKVKIVISAPFWQRTWFYIMCGSLIMLTVILVTRSLAQRKIKEKLRQLEKQQAIDAERNRISKDMHDEIGSGLTRIALMTELMHTHKQLDEKTKQDVNEIAGSSRQLVETMSEIIWTLNPHNDKLQDLLAYMREQSRHYFEPFTLNYTVSFPDTVPDIKLSNDQRRNLFLVSKEALNNALKHSGATDIEFIVKIDDQKINFSVVDNGKGLDRTQKRAGANGLRNMQQRMKDINGEIEWVSQNGAGTCVNFWIEL